MRTLPAVAYRARFEVLQPDRRQRREQHPPRVVRNAGAALLVPSHAIPRDRVMSDARRKAWETRRAKYGPMGHKMTEQIRDEAGLVVWLKTQAITKARKYAISGNPNDNELAHRFQAVSDLIESYRKRLRESGEAQDGLAAKIIELEGLGTADAHDAMMSDRGNEMDEAVRERQDSLGAFSPASSSVSNPNQEQ
jgi:hypothetical protein